MLTDGMLSNLFIPIYYVKLIIIMKLCVAMDYIKRIKQFNNFILIDS